MFQEITLEISISKKLPRAEEIINKNTMSILESMRKVLRNFGYYFISFVPHQFIIILRRSPFGKYLKTVFLDSKSSGEDLYKIQSGALKSYKIFTNPQIRPGYIFGTYEPDIAQAITDHCKSGWVVYDIGAHHGYFSLLMSKIIGKGGYCFAFEPLPENYDCIEKTIQANSLTNITVEQLAVSNHSNQKELHTIPQESAKSRFVNNIAPGEAYKFSKTVIVKTTSLDIYFKNCGITRIDMIKIDVEGAESQVIAGAQSILNNFKPILIMEIHDCGKDDLARHPIVIDLEGIGYQIDVLNVDHWRSNNQHILASPNLI